MKKLKLLIWAAVLIIADISLSKYISIFGAAPMLTYAFAVCVALMEEKFVIAAVTGGLCGIILGAYDSYSFELMFMFYAFSGILINRFFGTKQLGAFRAALICAAAAAVMKLVLYAFFHSEVTLGGLTKYLVPPAVYCAAAAAVLHPIIKNTIYKN